MKKRLLGYVLILGLLISSPLRAFISPDPEGHVASMDLYSYCNGDPVNAYDPDGRFGKGVGSGWNGSISSTDPSSTAFYAGNLLGGIWSGEAIGIQNGLGGTVHSLTLGNVSGAFGSDPNSFEYHSGRVGGAALGLGVAIGTGGAAYEAVGGGAGLSSLYASASANALYYAPAAVSVAYNVGNALSGESPIGALEGSAAKGTGQLVQTEFAFARGASIQTPGVTQTGEIFVRVGATEASTAIRAGSYAMPEATFNALGRNPAVLKDALDIPGSAPQFFRYIRPPAGTPIQRGIVPGGEFGGVGGHPEVIFPRGIN